MVPYTVFVQHKEFVLDSTPKLADTGHIPSMELTARATREAFGLKPLDENGKGMSQGEFCQLFSLYWQWMGAVKKKGSSLQTSTGLTESAMPVSLTKSDSPSSSTSTESTPAEPSLQTPPSSLD
jgi:hypothetical protein